MDDRPDPSPCQIAPVCVGMSRSLLCRLSAGKSARSPAAAFPWPRRSATYLLCFEQRRSSRRGARDASAHGRSGSPRRPRPLHLAGRAADASARRVGSGNRPCRQFGACGLLGTAGGRTRAARPQVPTRFARGRGSWSRRSRVVVRERSFVIHRQPDPKMACSYWGRNVTVAVSAAMSRDRGFALR